MLITIAYTASSAGAMAINGLFLLIVVRRDRRRRRQHPSDVARYSGISKAFILIWIAIVGEDLMMIGAGLGFLAGLETLGYLLAVMPLISILVGIFALRWLR